MAGKASSTDFTSFRMGSSSLSIKGVEHEALAVARGCGARVRVVLEPLLHVEQVATVTALQANNGMAFDH